MVLTQQLNKLFLVLTLLSKNLKIMKMKKYLLLVAASAFVITGCNQDELDIPQKGVISMDDFYKTDKDAESAMTVVYATTQK